MAKQLTRKEARKHAWRKKPYVYLQTVCTRCSKDHLAHMVEGCRLPTPTAQIPCPFCSGPADQKVACVESVPTRFDKPKYEWIGHGFKDVDPTKEYWRYK